MNKTTQSVFNNILTIGNYSFPVKGEPLKKKTYSLKCIRFLVEVEVIETKVSFGKNNEFECRAVVTSRVNIGDNLPLGSFNSYCHIDESETMKEAAKLFCEEHNLELCQSINNWPFFKAICQ